MSGYGKYSDNHRKMVVHILHTASWLDTKISALLKNYGITHVQFNILKDLEASHPEPQSVGKVKEGILFSNSDMTRLMDRLVTKNLVVRNICSENRRRIDVEITKEGLDLLNEINPGLSAILENYYADKVTQEEALWISNKLKEIRK